MLGWPLGYRAKPCAALSEIPAASAGMTESVARVRRDLWARVWRDLGVRVWRLGARVWRDLEARVRRDLGVRVWRDLGAWVWRDLGVRVRRDLGVRVWRDLGVRVWRDLWARVWRLEAGESLTPRPTAARRQTHRPDQSRGGTGHSGAAEYDPATGPTSAADPVDR